MITCAHCGAEFSSRQIINGKKRNLSARKYCTDCSPFGGHNTRPFNSPGGYISTYSCISCGENRDSCFYRKMRSMCKKCHAQYNAGRCKDRKKMARHVLGSKCLECGYSKYECSLAIHHLDPKQKDPNFHRMRGWSMRRIKKELASCILLCHNCHGAVHAGVLEISKVKMNRYRTRLLNENP